MSSTATPLDVKWDLSTLYSSLDDPKIDADWSALLERADQFAQAFRGKIDSPDLTADTLLAAIQGIESISQQVAKPYCFAELLFAGDTSNPKHGAFLQKQSELGTELSVKLLFFELELQKVDQSIFGPVLSDERLSNYRHYLNHVRIMSPHRLTEPEEVILEETANTGIRAWVRLFEEVTANHVYKYTAPGSDCAEEMSTEEVLDLLRDPDRAVRQAAADAFTAGLDEIERVVVFTYNNLLQDRKVTDRLRSHPYAEHSRHLSNELDKETVDLVIKLCKENYGLVERFYNVKREILGLEKLTHVDRYAPLFEAKGEVSWEGAREIVTSAFGSFSTELASRADEFFSKGWIDAESRKGKSSGAFCMYVTPDTHPYVLMTYLNKMDDVMTLAHELGHGVHASLSRDQSYLNFHGTLPLAELASTFGEMLVFERVTAQATDKDKLALYAEKIEGVFATVFRQAAMFQFEQASHEARRTQGELTSDQFNAIWHSKLQEMFGSSVELGDQHRGWWKYISHFFAVPFYVYAYSFGELLALSLYGMAKAQGSAFESKYVELLRLGGSKTPHELMETVGVDLRSEAFWKGGFAVIEDLVSRFEVQWSALKSS